MTPKEIARDLQDAAKALLAISNHAAMWTSQEDELDFGSQISHLRTWRTRSCA